MAAPRAGGAAGAGCSILIRSAGASIETRKKIIRLLIAEIIADVVGDKLELVIHWHGGDHHPAKPPVSFRTYR
jgi:hypothetical protein